MICSASLCNVMDMPKSDEQFPHERLAEARKAAGFETAAKFAKKVGIHETTYRAYESGQNGFSKLAPTLAKHLGVTVNWLLEGEDPEVTQRRAAERIARVAQVVSDYPPIRGAHDSDGAITIRRVDLSYAMGDGTDLQDYPEEQGMQFDPNFLRRLTRAEPSMLFVARGTGDSMMPTLINDDMVVIDTSQRRLNLQDRIWACALHGVGMIKRLRVVGEGRVEVLSDNPTVGSTEVSANELYIVGRVVWIGREV